MDALGAPQSVLVLGGSSDLAWSTLQALPLGRLRRVTLAGRASRALEARARALLDQGVQHVAVVPFDACDASTHAPAVASAFAVEDVDLVILAFGQLGSQEEMEVSPEEAVRLVQVNYAGAVSASLHAARQLRAQGHGTLVVLSSVAADRPRRSNYVYGSTKAGLDAFARGLGDSLAGSGVNVLVVRPGYVRTRMTRGVPEAPLAADPDVVGKRIARAVRTGRQGTVYAPGVLRPVMALLKALPGPVFRRLAP